MVVNLIDKFQCNPEETGLEDRTLLHSACIGGNTELVNYLILKLKFDPLSANKTGCNSLHYAAHYGQEEVVRLLIRKYKCPVER